MVGGFAVAHPQRGAVRGSLSHRYLMSLGSHLGANNHAVDHDVTWNPVIFGACSDSFVAINFLSC